MKNYIIVLSLVSSVLYAAQRDDHAYSGPSYPTGNGVAAFIPLNDSYNADLSDNSWNNELYQYPHVPAPIMYYQSQVPSPAPAAASQHTFQAPQYPYTQTLVPHRSAPVVPQVPAAASQNPDFSKYSINTFSVPYHDVFSEENKTLKTHQAGLEAKSLGEEMRKKPHLQGYERDGKMVFVTANDTFATNHHIPKKTLAGHAIPLFGFLHNDIRLKRLFFINDASQSLTYIQNTSEVVFSDRLKLAVASLVCGLGVYAAFNRWIRQR